TFLGDIEVDGDAQRASGKIVVGRDNMGTTLTLTPEGAAKKRTTGTKDGGAPDADAPKTDTRTLVDQAFSGTMHFLRIGKNQTVLVRGDTNGKTAHYKKVK